MSPTTSGRAGGVATDEAPRAQLRERVKSEARLFAFTGRLFLAPFTRIGSAGAVS